MKGLYLFLLLVLVLPLVAAQRPEARTEGDVLVVPHSDDGREYYLAEEERPYFYNEWGYMHVIEYDPNYTIRTWWHNNRTIGIRIEANPSRIVDTTPYVEVCISDRDEFDIPGLRRRDVHEPIHCQGSQAVSFEDVPINTNFTFMVKEPIWMYEWYIGEGARGGGGGVGCTAGCSPCYINSISGGSTPGSVNTETNFYHSAGVNMATCTDFLTPCTCALNYQHRPFSTYAAYTSSYPSSFSNSVAKLVSGSTIKIITTSGTYSNTVRCGGKEGSLYLRVYGSGYLGATVQHLATVSCNDAQSPNIVQSVPPNNTEINASWAVFECNATDNTGLKYIDLYHNASGSYGLNQSQAYGNLVYSASKSWNVTGWQDQNGTGWYCRARDTDSPNNDAYTGVRYFNVGLPVLVSLDDFLASGATLGLILGLFGLIGADRKKKKKEEGYNGS